MDELAFKLNIDPIELRLRNEPQKDEGLNLPFSSRHFVECLKVGAEKFGWSQRNPKIGSMKRDGLTIGWGVAGASWIAERMESEATVELLSDGTARVSSATQDIGTGTYTVLSLIVSEKTGIPTDRIEAVLGDSSLPAGAISGGSWATASLIPAVTEAIEKAQKVVLGLATTGSGAVFANQKEDALAFTAGRVHLKEKAPETGVPFAEILTKGNLRAAVGTG